ncbi:MAG: spore germination protein [Thermacetogenium sp.]|nr:spore germination protein [Thermacetogenium sp.]
MRRALFPKTKVGAVFLLLLFLLAFGCSGCWSAVEIEQMSFISVVGVDFISPQELLVSFQIVNPRALAGGAGGAGGGGGNEPPVIVLSVRARTVPDALAKLASESPRVVRFKQLNAIVLGEELAKKGVAQVMDFFARHWEMRRSIWVLIARGSAEDVLLKGAPLQEKVPGMAIKMNMERSDELAPVRYPVRLGDFLSDMTRDGTDAIASSVEVGPMQEARTDNSSKEQGGDTKEQATTGEKELVFRGAGIFNGDKLVAFLGPQEARGARWMRGNITGGIYTVPTPPQGTWASLVTERAEVRIEPVITKDDIRFRVKIKDDGYI